MWKALLITLCCVWLDVSSEALEAPQYGGFAETVVAPSAYSLMGPTFGIFPFTLPLTPTQYSATESRQAYGQHPVASVNVGHAGQSQGQYGKPYKKKKRYGVYNQQVHHQTQGQYGQPNQIYHGQQGYRKPVYGQQGYVKPVYGQQSYVGSVHGQQSQVGSVHGQGYRKPYGQQQYGKPNRPYGKPYYQGQGYNHGQGYKKPYQHGQGYKKPYNQGQVYNQGHGNKKPYHHGQVYNQGQGYKKPYQHGQGYNKPYNQGSGQHFGNRKPYNKRPGFGIHVDIHHGQQGYSPGHQVAHNHGVYGHGQGNRKVYGSGYGRYQKQGNRRYGNAYGSY